MKQLISFFNKDFVKNVLTLLSASAISQIIIFSSILFLTRLFSTEIFGMYMLFSSSILILKPIISLQYELAILLPKEDKYAINILSLSGIITFVMSFFLLIVILIFKNKILYFFEIEKLSYFIYFIPLSTFLAGIINSLNFWNNRKNNFKSIAIGGLVKSTSMSSSQIATGLSTFKNIGLIPGVILSQFFQLLYLFKETSQSIIKLKSEISIHRMFILFKKYKDIPIYNTLINFLNTLSNEIPTLMITKYFGLSSVGIYGLAIKVGRAPSGIIQESVGQVFFNKANETYNKNENLQEVVKKTALNLLKISAFIFLPLFIVSYFLHVIFGQEWIQSENFLRILIPWLFVMFISSPLTNLIIILNKQKINLFYDFFLLICRFLAFYAGFHFFDSLLASLILFSGIGVIFNIFIIIYLYKVSKYNNQGVAYK